MTEKEFNLLSEPWIRVIDENCEISEASLLEVFRNAHLNKGLCGEIPTQDFAVLRLLLAVLHTVFSRYDLSGAESPLEDFKTALNRWKELWNNKKFPEKPIADYLESQRENFYLFHPERPFYQCSHAKIGTEYSSAKLNGNVSESSNKLRLFSNVSGTAKERLEFSEAARWLIYINAYDDTSAKPSAEAKKLTEKLPSPGAGWLGKLGLLCADGNNLFETLMLNLVFFDENNEVSKKENPIWERERIPDRERVKINMPDNISELYTLQSRRLYLKKDKDKVTGYYLLGGDFFEKENAFLEPMTVWRNIDTKNAQIFTPRRHDASKQFWRDFSALACNDEKQHRPGILIWLDKLFYKKCIPNRHIYLKIASVQYGDKDFFVNNLFSDSLQIYSSLISELNEEFQKVVIRNIDFCDDVAKRVWIFAKDVNLAAGGDFLPKEPNCSAKVFADKTKAEFYSLIDMPFRKWLSSLNPETDDESERLAEWRVECIKFAKMLGEKTISQVDMSAVFGKTIKEKSQNGEKSKTINFSAARAYNIFNSMLKKLKQGG